MSGNMRDELLKMFPNASPAVVEDVPTPPAYPDVPKTRAVRPADCILTVQEAFNRYCVECAGKELKDPRGIVVSLLEHNFPKLIKLYTNPTQNRPAAKAKASRVLPSLRAGNFDPEQYTWHVSRLECLFWIPEIICDPDGIYPNAASQIEGDEVYVKRYASMGREIKLIFISVGLAGERVVITSFADDVLKGYCGLPALYLKAT